MPPAVSAQPFLWSAYALQMTNVMGPLQGASQPGMPFMVAELGPTARLVLEVAWGANLAADSASWAWTDITEDAYQKPGISFRYGRANEASTTQPANLSVTLDNSRFRYSLGGVSPNWPNVRTNTPVRLRIDPDGTGFVTAFQGNAVGFTPKWNTKGNVATVQLTAAGTLRRLIQGFDRPVSAPRRYYTQRLSLKPGVYYPLDEGPLSTAGSALIGKGAAIIDPFYQITFGNSSVKYFGQGKLASWLPEGIALNNSSVMKFDVPPLPKLTEWWLIDGLITYAETASVGFFETIASIEDGTSSWGVRFDANAKTVTFLGYIPNTGPIDLNTVTHKTLFDGDVHHVRLWVDQEGADVHIVLYVDDVFVGIGVQANQTLKQPDQFLLFGGDPNRTFYGHFAWGNNVSGMLFGGDGAYYERGANGEPATTRIVRLCTENKIPLDIQGMTTSQTDTGSMGPQATAGTVALLRQCEEVDQGVLYDGLSDGLAYACRNIRENATAALTIDVAAGELFPEFAPTHDDARIVNKVTVKREGGTDYTYEDVTGPLGTATLGTYDDSATINIYSDFTVPDQASWRVHLGTAEGYRYPSVSLNIRGNPRLARLVLSLRPGQRIDLVNVSSVLTGFNDGTISLLIEGVAMNVDPMTWVVTLQCSLFDPWRIVTLAAATGDTDPTVCHLQTSGSRLSALVAVGATSLTVETTSGPVWTQTADDFPFDVLVGGIRATVTNIVGAASPQTFTVTPMPTGRPGNAPVEVFSPSVPRL